MSDRDSPTDFLIVRGVSEHYLKHFSVRVPHDRLTVVTGISGSGKSSLVFDTICREGQRRFLQTLSTHARQMLGTMKPPVCESIEGLRPTLAVAQQGRSSHARSTVGTMTDLHDALRLLFARLGVAYCPSCHLPYISSTAESLLDIIINTTVGKPVRLLAPVILGHRGSFRRELEDLRHQGLLAARIDGVLTPLMPTPKLTAKMLHGIEAVVADPLPSDPSEALALVQKALQIGKDVLLYQIETETPQRLSRRHACSQCGGSPPEIGPRLFSFNSAYGACPACQGLGLEDAIDPDLLIGDDTRTVREGALVLTTPKGYIIYSQVTMDVLDQVCRAHGFTVDVPWRDLTDEQRRVILYGSDRLKIPFGKHPLESRLKWSGITARPREEDYYKGILPVMEDILKRDRNPSILRFVRSRTCQACQGARLNAQALAVEFHTWTIDRLSALSLNSLVEQLGHFSLNDRERTIADPIIGEMQKKLTRLCSLGLGHLTLDRPSASLSAGEYQRVRLALQAFTDLRHLLYVLDEPSLGLHPRDQRQLLDLLFHLRDAGNTILAVEHRRDAVLAADWLVDLGPGAGPQGGELLYEGPLSPFLASGSFIDSPTRHWLTGTVPAGADAVDVSPTPAEAGRPALQVLGAAQHNLKQIDVCFPLQKLIAVTGVSGAGKSTLVHGILARSLRRSLHRAGSEPGAHREILGLEFLDKVIAVDQQPIGRTSRSNPATYTGVFDLIRDLYARQPLARTRGWSKSRFSWNVAGGRCEACQGTGTQEIGLHLLDPVEVVCEACGGQRYLPETLEVTWNGLSIAAVLSLSVREARVHFDDQKQIMAHLDAMNDVGLDYLSLGQSSTTLSGGEAQRLKLATELARPGTGRTLYILDEPAAGLHHADIERLATVLRRLVSAGNTVIAVEHHPEFLLTADWIIDLGPEGGERGGHIVATGTPWEILKCPTSFTGQALKRLWQTSDVAKPAPEPSSPSLTPPTEQRSPAPHLPSGIHLQDVRTHNLRDVQAFFPDRQLTVVTGVSGSGKTSLVMDTLYAESHRRYVESLSTYARRFIQQSERPQLGAATGLTPTIAVTNRRGTANPRSTVGTMSGCLDLWRVLMARSGERFCPECGSTLQRNVCAAGHFVGTAPLLARHFSFNDVLGACDHCHGLGQVAVCDIDRLVRFPERSLLDGALDGTRIGRFYGERDGQYVATLRAAGASLGHDFSLSWRDLTPEARQIAMHGCGDREFEVTWQYRRGKRTGEHHMITAWKGFVSLIQEEFDRKRADERVNEFAELMVELPCAVCNGDRLKPEFRAVRWQGRSLGEWCRSSLTSLLDAGTDFLNRHGAHQKGTPESESLTATETAARALIEALLPRLHQLVAAGLGYLSLDRTVQSLSGGEFRRFLLACQLSSSLTGVTYVLDEPTVGLHERDTDRLLGLLHDLRRAGNTVVVIEHDPEVIRAADHLIEVGPGAGSEGGTILATGTWPQIREHAQSLTARWLTDSAPWPIVTAHHLIHPGVLIRGARAHNLKRLDLDIPLGSLVALTGVSGSGKSTLIEDVLLPSLTARHPINCDACSSSVQFHRLLLVDQQLPSGSENSLVATITRVLDPIRTCFASTDDARSHGIGADAFSPFGSVGRCETCQGSGGERVELDFLAAVRLVCEACEGKRFNHDVLGCRYREQSIADVLAMTVSKASTFFSDQPEILARLEPLQRVGLVHLTLDRTTSSLSAGERQRLRLALALTDAHEAGVSNHPTLFLFDEPTTGLHLADVARLFEVFQGLLTAGHSLIVVEHHLELIRRSDWVIDLGPEGGEAGGNLVFAGPPADLAHHPTSATGIALRTSACGDGEV